MPLTIGQLQILFHGSCIGLFWLLGLLIKRSPINGLHRDLWINAFTGASIVILLKPIMMWLQPLCEWHLVNVDHWPLALRFLFSFVLLDFSRYWLHRMHHRVPFFWQFHRVHHSTEVLDATAGLRMHAFDFLQLGLLPLLWFSILIDTRSWSEWLIPSVLMVGVFFDGFQHSNMRFNIHHPLGKLWHGLLNNPHFHAWHHVRDAQNCDGNYGNVLLIWDRLFKSDVTQKNIPNQLGLVDNQALQNDPLSLQLLRKRHSSPS